MKKINMEKVQNDLKKIYEFSFRINVMQNELESMLVAIDRNGLNYKKRNMPKEFFEAVDQNFKKESATLIKKINKLVSSGLSLINSIVKELQLPKAGKHGTKQN